MGEDSTVDSVAEDDAAFVQEMEKGRWQGSCRYLPSESQIKRLCVIARRGAMRASKIESVTPQMVDAALEYLDKRNLPGEKAYIQAILEFAFSFRRNGAATTATPLMFDREEDDWL